MGDQNSPQYQQQGVRDEMSLRSFQSIYTPTMTFFCDFPPKSQVYTLQQ